MSSRGRASMREGPLSELFRSTDRLGDELRAEEAHEPAPSAGEPGQADSYVAVIRVVGIGGAGCNAIDRMIEAGLRGVEFVAINTDRQALDASEADVRIPVGLDTTRGLGTGGDLERGARAVGDGEAHIRRALRGSDLVFIAAGEGGGTGTGGAPLVARIAREMGALTVAVVTRPFAFEGKRRTEAADRGLEQLQEAADTVIVIPNDRLMAVLQRGTSVVDAFKVCDDLLRQGVQGITDMITLPGLINLDFADVRTIIRGAGSALLGIGYATGSNRAVEAAQAAIASPLLETPIDGARGILLGMTGGPDLSLFEVSEAARIVADAADPDANIIFGATIDPDLQDQVWVTVVAANFSGVRAAPLPEPPEAGAARPPERRRAADIVAPRRAPRVRELPYPAAPASATPGSSSGEAPAAEPETGPAGDETQLLRLPSTRPEERL